MHLLVARDAVDTHLSVAGDIIDPDTSPADKARAAAQAAAFYASWLPGLYAGTGMVPLSYARFGALAGHMRFVERASRKLRSEERRVGKEAEARAAADTKRQEKRAQSRRR